MDEPAMNYTRLFLICLSVCGAAISARSADASKESTKPNILVLIADDASLDFGCYGNKGINTPNIDALAASGLRIDRAFLTGSQCSPSRTAMITGQFAHTIGTEKLSGPIPPSTKTIPDYLGEQGYFTGLMLKNHMEGKGNQRFDWYGRGWGFYVKDPEGWDRGVADEFSTFLDRADDKPFFMWLGFIDPHRKYNDHAIEKVNDPKDAAVPPHLVDDEATRRDLADYYDEISRMDGHIGEVLAELKKRKQLENTLIVFVSDNGMPFPRAKGSLYDTGIRTPLVFSWGDRIEAGSVHKKDLVSTIDLAPTLLDAAGIAKPEPMYGESLLPLLLGDANSSRTHIFSERHHKRSNEYYLTLRSATHKLIRTFDMNADRPLITVGEVYTSPSWYSLQKNEKAGKLTPGQRRILETQRAQIELYDLVADPHELVNIADNPENQDIVRDLMGRMQQLRRETNDPYLEK
jgi:arylsulfatase A-like enzyme